MGEEAVQTSAAGDDVGSSDAVEDPPSEIEGGPPSEVPKPRPVPGNFIVALAPGQDPNKVAPVIAREYGGRAVHIYDQVVGGFGFEGPEDAIARMRDDPRVRHVEQNYTAHVTAVRPELNAIRAPQAWTAGHTGAGALLAILDTGVASGNTYLNGTIDGKPSHIAGVFSCISGSNGQDGHYHGTATMGNAVGAIGVLPDGKAYSIQVLNSSGSGTTDTVLCGLNKAKSLIADGAKIGAVNMSLAGAASAAIQQAIADLRNSGVPVVVAAGNTGGSVQYPAAYPESIAVSGLSQSNTSLASWSSRGSQIDLGAPGANIQSLKRTSPWCCDLRSGTSRSAPHVAAVAALLKAQHPTWDVATIVNTLQKSGFCPPNQTQNTRTGNCNSTRNASPLRSGDSDGYTEPALNMEGAAVSGGPPPGATVPGAPRSVSAEPGNAQASVSWSPPSSDGGSAITQYTVTSNPHGRTATTSGTQTSATVTGLTNATTYTFTVRATNLVGTGEPSAASNPVTPSASLPGAPRNVSAVAGNAEAMISWSPPSSDGGSPITGYTVTESVGGTSRSATSSQTSLTFTGLTNGTTYTFSVAASNSVGQGSSASSGPVTPSAAPPVWTRIEQNESEGVTYTGTWSKVNTSCGSGSWYRTSSTAGSTANLAFNGSGIRFITALGSNRGHVEAWVDDQPAQTFTTYATSQSCRFQLFEWSLAPGSHTIHIRVKGTKDAASSATTIVVDAFEYLS